jgi:hypothetical protein
MKETISAADKWNEYQYWNVQYLCYKQLLVLLLNNPPPLWLSDIIFWEIILWAKKQSNVNWCSPNPK